MRLYAVPAFLDAAWLSGLGDDAESYRNWFVHLAQGEKLEALRFPMPMTHRAAHHFLQAPSHFSIPAALHWGQIRAANGSAILAEAVAESFLHDLQEDESFWFSAVIFFVNHSDFPNWQIAPALDYLRFRKAQEPNFTMKGRTATALLSLMQEWHETLARMKAKTAAVWNPSGIRPMKMSLPDTLSPALCDWFMIEITDALSLVEEGREMRHCVRSYQEGCVLGENEYLEPASPPFGQPRSAPNAHSRGQQPASLHCTGTWKMQSGTLPNARQSAFGAGEIDF